MQILIVDDDKQTLKTLQVLTRSWGYTPQVATSANEAWHLLVDFHPPKLVLVDWLMPEVSGLELLQKIRADKATADTYAIMLTIKDRIEDIIEGLNMGADNYITKPFDNDELRARLEAGRRTVTLTQHLTERGDELQSKLEEIDALKGILAICNTCHQLLDDNGSWIDFEAYLSERSKSLFSHGICPDCYQKLTGRPWRR